MILPPLVFPGQTLAYYGKDLITAIKKFYSIGSRVSNFINVSQFAFERILRLLSQINPMANTIKFFTMVVCLKQVGVPFDQGILTEGF